MELADVHDEVAILRRWPRCFTLREALDSVSTEIQRQALRSLLLSDPLFIVLRQRSGDEEQLVHQSTLLGWFARLNVRLARIGKYRLAESQLLSATSYLRTDGRWDSLAHDVVSCAEPSGLVKHSYTTGDYVFPLARMLSFLRPSALALAGHMLEELTQQSPPQQELNQILDKWLARGWSLVDARVAQIVQARAGLMTGKRITLRELALARSLTRERVRQLEREFWDSLPTWGAQRQRPFLTALLSALLVEAGRLVTVNDSARAIRRKFLARWAGIPYIELGEAGLLVLGILPKQLAAWKWRKSWRQGIDEHAVAKYLESSPNVCLGADDVRLLSRGLAQARRQQLRLIQRVSLALHTIGRPAHYSKVAEVHNALFAEYATSERSVHVALGREKHGVVWIGAKGTYALRQWGYRRPSKGLFETVAEIVEKRYEQTRRPIGFPVILAEVGKHRRLVNQNSVVLATCMNPRLRRIGKGMFIPVARDATGAYEIRADELDQILEDFEKSRVLG